MNTLNFQGHEYEIIDVIEINSGNEIAAISDSDKTQTHFLILAKPFYNPTEGHPTNIVVTYDTCKYCILIEDKKPLVVQMNGKTGKLKKMLRQHKDCTTIFVVKNIY